MRFKVKFIRAFIGAKTTIHLDRFILIKPLMN
jgi:hypothetical protein